VSGCYPSRKIGVTIQFESHKNELARIQELEHASDVIEFYDQPPSIKLDRETAVAYGQIVQTSPTSPHSLPGLINLVLGNSLNWDGKNWTIVNVGDTKIGLINIDHFFTELPIAAGGKTEAQDEQVKLSFKAQGSIRWQWSSGRLLQRQDRSERNQRGGNLPEK
jgi:hypothetical protein